VNSQSQNKDLQIVKLGFYTTQIFSNFSLHFQKRSGQLCLLSLVIQEIIFPTVQAN